MNIRTIGVLLVKELKHGTRNVIFIFATLIPLVLSVILSLVFGNLVLDAPRIGILDEGASQMTALFQGLDYVSTRVYTDRAALRSDVEDGALEVGLVLPAGFDDALRDSTETTLTVWFWGEGHVNDQATLVTAMANNVVTISGRDVPVTVNRVYLGEGEIASWSERLLPLLVLMTIILGGSLIPAMSLVTERQQRTLAALTITPASVWDVLVAKGLVGVLVSVAMGLIILALNRAFGSDPLLLGFVLILSATAAAVFGVILGALTKDVQGLLTIVKATGILLYAPAFIQIIPQVPQWIAQIFPTYYMLAPVQDVAINGKGLADIAPQVAILIGLIVALAAVLTLIIRRKQEAQTLAY